MACPLFVQILRAYLETSGSLATGQLHAVGDKRLAPALRVMHGDPGRAWQLEELAQAAKRTIGIAPRRYRDAARATTTSTDADANGGLPKFG